MAAHILVAGGGIGGLAAALALAVARRGHRIDVLEQAECLRDIGAGVQLGPNATRRLRGMGLGAALDAIAARPPALVVRSARDGAELARLPLGETLLHRYGAPYCCVHRADLHALLHESARQFGCITLEAGVRVTQVRADDALVRVSSADARVWESDALIGADGLWSTVREQLDATRAPPRATGHTAWRGLIEQAALPAAQRRRNVEVWLGPRLHCVAYPVRAGQWLNVVVLAEAAPEGDARDWDQASSLFALRRATGPCGFALQALFEAVPQWRAWSLGDRAPLASPAEMAQGRIALLGDAAHPMLPYLAQGAGMAIEDAVALSGALADADVASVPYALAGYARARWRRNAHVQQRARRNGEIFHAAGALRVGRDAALRLLGARLLDQPWLYAG